jgi:hypothetical protein
VAEYDWKNVETGEVVTTSHWSEPPDDSGKWRRLYSFGVGRVEGAGGSRGMPSTRLPGSRKRE